MDTPLHDVLQQYHHVRSALVLKLSCTEWFKCLTTVEMSMVLWRNVLPALALCWRETNFRLVTTTLYKVFFPLEGCLKHT